MPEEADAFAWPDVLQLCEYWLENPPPGMALNLALRAFGVVTRPVGAAPSATPPAAPSSALTPLEQNVAAAGGVTLSNGKMKLGGSVKGFDQLPLPVQERMAEHHRRRLEQQKKEKERAASELP